jgi:uncharacterized membrane protein YeaQ/YmgE (transglycosylase-associated protein family)
MTKTRKVILAVLGLSVGLIASTLHANPTQEDVFKSISDNMSEKSSDSGQFLAVMAAIAGAAVLVAVFSKRKERVVRPKTLNHQGKLLKEVIRTTSLKPAAAQIIGRSAIAGQRTGPAPVPIGPGKSPPREKQQPRAQSRRATGKKSGTDSGSLEVSARLMRLQKPPQSGGLTDDNNASSPMALQLSALGQSPVTSPLRS